MGENRFLRVLRRTSFGIKKENYTKNYPGIILIYVDASDCEGMDIPLLYLLCVL
jgi:hypothetical protein